MLAVRNVGTNNELCKARFLVQGHTDSENNLLVHTSTNIRQRSIRILIAIAAIFGFRIRTQNISQVYLQSASKLTRDVYIKPKDGFELGCDKLLKLLEILYGLSDSGDYYHITTSNHLIDDLKMHPLTEGFGLLY